MATCKDCLHHKSCFNMAFRCGCKAEALDGAETCEDFKNKADYAEVKHGYWADTDPLEWACSVCGYRVKRWNSTPYCPNCGAKMDGRSDINEVSSQKDS